MTRQYPKILMLKNTGNFIQLQQRKITMWKPSLKLYSLGRKLMPLKQKMKSLLSLQKKCSHRRNSKGIWNQDEMCNCPSTFLVVCISSGRTFLQKQQTVFQGKIQDCMKYSQRRLHFIYWLVPTVCELLRIFLMALGNI